MAMELEFLGSLHATVIESNHDRVTSSLSMVQGEAVNLKDTILRGSFVSYRGRDRKAVTGTTLRTWC